VAAVKAETDTAAPGAQLLRFSSVLPAGSDNATGGPISMRFALYAGQQGGEPLWSEAQKIEVARDGSYSVLLGTGTTGGLPASVFQEGNARWLGVAVGESDPAEQPRLLLVGVPYAFDAANAETLGGLPATEYVRATDLKATDVAATAEALAAATPLTATTITGTGTPNYVPKFTTAANIADSESLYVINKTATSFEVRESKGGTSTLIFDYRIMAKRRGYEAQRLTDVTERFNAEQKAAHPPMDPNAAPRAPRLRPQLRPLPATPDSAHLPDSQPASASRQQPVGQLMKPAQ
jgi:hypothetical protein